MRVDYSPFEGKTVVGAPSHVLSRGELVVENDKRVGQERAAASSCAAGPSLQDP